MKGRVKPITLANYLKTTLVARWTIGGVVVVWCVIVILTWSISHVVCDSFGFLSMVEEVPDGKSMILLGF